MTTTNPIDFNKKSFLINYLRVILQRNENIHKQICINLNTLLHILTKKAPEDYKPKPTMSKTQFKFELPQWKDKDNKTYFYLSKISEEYIISFIYKSFFFTFNEFMQEHKDRLGINRSIFLFIDKYNLDVDKFEMLQKRNYRMKNIKEGEKTRKIREIFSEFD